MLGCVTGATIFNRGDWLQEGAESWFGFSRNPAPLSDSGLTLFFSQRFAIVKRKDEPERWKVTTQKYMYAIATGADHQEVFSFHWDRRAQADIPYAHLHVGFGARMAEPPVDCKIHIPTSRVPVEDVVFFLIDQLRVNPRRADWRDVLGESRSRFIKYKTAE